MFEPNQAGIDALFRGQELGKVIDDAGEAVERTARELAPRGRTGRLKRSITHDLVHEDGEPVARVFWDRSIAWYGHFVEFGTSHSEPVAMLRNAIHKPL